MQQFSRLPLFLFVILLQSFLGLGQQIWGNPIATMEMSERFIGCLKQSSVFSFDQMDDLDMIAETVRIQRNKMGDKVTEHKLKAMTMSMVGSIAETAVSSPNGVTSDLMDNIDRCLTGSMLQVIGTVDQTLRNEVLKMVSLINANEGNLSSSANAAARVSGASSVESAGVGIASGYPALTSTGSATSKSQASGYSTSSAGGYRGATGFGAGAVSTGGYGSGAAFTGAGVSSVYGGTGTETRAGSAEGGAGGYGAGSGGGFEYDNARGTVTSSSFAASTGADIVTSNRDRYGTSATAGAASTGAYGGALNRLASPEAVNRISSNIGPIAAYRASALSNVFPNIFSGVSASAAGVSNTEIVFQSLLELLSILVHILSNSTIGYVDSRGTDASLSAVSQAVLPFLA